MELQGDDNNQTTDDAENLINMCKDYVTFT
jgi:hypothetical protein